MINMFTIDGKFIRFTSERLLIGTSELLTSATIKANLASLR